MKFWRCLMGATAVVAVVLTATTASVASAQGDEPQDPPTPICPAEFTLDLMHFLEHQLGFCQHHDLPYDLPPAEARALLAQFELSEFQRNPAFSWIFCGPGEDPTEDSIQLHGMSFHLGCVTADEGRRVDYLNFEWGFDYCEEGEQVGYYDGGNGTIACGPTEFMVECASDNSAGVSGLRCHMDPTEVVDRVLAEAEPLFPERETLPSGQEGRYIDPEDGTRCWGVYWNEAEQRFRCA